DLATAMRTADVVIAHAGIGSAIAALEAGKCPILVPRSASHAEHVDDHQRQIAGELSRRGLAISRPAEAIRFDDLKAAMNVTIRERKDPPAIVTGAFTDGEAGRATAAASRR